MKDIIVVGELNVDVILDELSSMPEINKEKIANRMQTVMGSSSAIFACNISRLGMQVAFIGKLGTDNYSKFIIDALQKKDVDTSYIVFDEKQNTGATIILNIGENRMMITYPGTMALLTLDDISVEALKNAKHLHFSSFFLQPAIRNNVVDMMKMAKGFGLTTSIDLQWDPEEKWDFDYAATLPYVDVFLPNESEILCLTAEKDIYKAIAKLDKHANIIAVKCGSKGCIVSQKGKNFSKAPYLNKEVVDTVGAGDSFNAGFIYKFKQGADLQDCADFANLTGAISTTATGGTKAFENKKKIIETALNRFKKTIQI